MVVWYALSAAGQAGQPAMQARRRHHKSTSQAWQAWQCISQAEGCPCAGMRMSEPPTHYLSFLPRYSCSHSSSFWVRERGKEVDSAGSLQVLGTSRRTPGCTWMGAEPGTHRALPKQKCAGAGMRCTSKVKCPWQDALGQQ